jgi:cytochrome c5
MVQIRRLGTAGSIAGGLLMLAAAAGAAGQSSSTPEKGEQVLSGSCLNCHDIRPIQITALDKEGWNGIVEAMIDRGANVDKMDMPALVDYLARIYGPLPDGAGKKILLNTCTLCHDLTRVKRTQHDPEGWQELLSAMMNEGAMISEQDYPVLLAYLARNFKP